jgi:ADP-heptose:LPS heptosyltransferase
MIIEQWGRNWMAPLLSFFFPIRKTVPEATHQALQNATIKKILLIRPHQGLGDLLLASPIFRAIKKTYPAVEIHFLGDTYNPLAIRNNPHLTRIWHWDKKAMRNPIFLWRFLRALRQEKFGLALAVSSRVPSFTSFLLGRLSGSEVVWAYDTTPFYEGANWSRYLADVILPAPNNTDPEWVKFMNLVRPLGINGDYAPEFAISSSAKEWAKEQWRRYPVPVGKIKIGLFLGGNPDRPERLWPANRWAELITALDKRPDVALVLIVPPENLKSGSGAAEPGVYEEVAQAIGKKLPTFADKDLVRVAAFLQGLDLFVVVDGGLFHIAVASHVRTLGLFFMTDPVCWAPPVPWQTVLRPADDLPLSLTHNEVYQKICEMVLKSELEKTVQK